MCVTTINSSSKTRVVQGEVDPRTSSGTSRAISLLPLRRRTPKRPCSFQRSIRRVRLLGSSQASNNSSSSQKERNISDISESSANSAHQPQCNSIKKRCQPRREGQEGHPNVPDNQASEPGMEYISSLSDTPSSLRGSRRGNDGHFLSLHAETFRLLDFEDDDDDSDGEDFHA